MSEITPMPKDELAQCEERTRRLAQEKSYLQLVNNLMMQLSQATGIESVVENMLKLLLDNLGGSNVSVYYFVGTELYSADVYGRKVTIEAMDDEIVKAVFDSHELIEVEHDFEQTKMLTPEFTKSSTWAIPLLVGSELVGVLKLEGMLMAVKEIRQQLEPFFQYAALVLRNEISGYAKLQKANDELTETNAQLSDEIKQRQQAEESLQKSYGLLQFKLESILEPDVEIRDQELGNIIDASAIQSILEDVTRLTGMATAVLDLQGNVLVATGWQEICTKFHRLHPETLQNCTESDLYLAQNVKAGEHVTYKCKNGLWDVVTPLFIGGKHMGNIFTGQFFYEGEPLETKAFESMAERYGFDRERYLAALQRVPRFSHDQIRTLMDFLVKFAEIISKLGYGNLKLAKAFLENKRIEEELRKANNDLEGAVAERTAKLQESKELFKSLHDNLSVGVVMITPDMRILTINPRMLDLFPGVDPTVNPLCYSVFNSPPRNEPCIDCPVIKTFRDGSQYTTEREVSSLNGIRIIRMSSSAITDRDGNITAAIETIEDITEHKTIEAQLRQAQKMEAIGTLAGGIAHDFNNMLSPILGYSELVADMLPADSKERGLVLEILTAGKRATQLVKQILTFSRQTEQRRQPVQIHLIIKEALKLLRSSIPTTIDITQNVADCGLVMADPTQIHQILMNLCTNAYHAMRETGGELSVSLSVVEITEQDYLDNLVLRSGPHVMLSVRDTGCGMPKELQERIFEPYFTTKKQGEGTGLGLSVVHGIVQSHHGHMTVYSEPGKGTEFHVYLPQVKVQNGGLVEESGAVAIPHGSGTILVVDDEVPVGQLLRDILLSLGYKVVLCSSSTQALEAFQQNNPRFDLVLTDMTMPDMNGAELTRKIKHLNPAMPVILCTGFSEIMDEAQAKRIGVVGYLFKPVSKKQLAQTIHEILGEKVVSGHAP